MKITKNIAAAIIVLFMAIFQFCAKNGIKEGKHLFILSGQSNMAIFNPDDFFTPLVQDEFGANKVIVVKDAQGGQPIRRWYKKWEPAENYDPSMIGDLYDRLMAKVDSSIQGETIQTMTFIWMQGERDSREQLSEYYAESLKGLIAQLSEDLGKKRIYFVIGRISDYGLKKEKQPHWPMIREAQVNVAESSPYGEWIDTDDLNGEVNEIHYTREGYKILGERFAQKAIELIYRYQ